MKNLFRFFFLVVFSFSFSQKPQPISALQSGPMVGYCEMTEAMIWLQTTKIASVRIEYFAIDKPSAVFVSDTYSTDRKSTV